MRTRDCRSGQVLSKVNTFLTAIAALASTFIGVWVALIDGHVKEIERRNKAEEASYNFAHEFLTVGKDDLAKDPRRTQLAVAALNIIAQASSSRGGESDVATRAELPVHMALLYGDPGSIAVLDREMTQSKRWVDFASGDPDTATRVTAIRALCSLCRSALSDGNLSRMESCAKYIDQLLKLINEDESAETLRLRTDALTEKTNLVAYLRRNSDDLNNAKTLASTEKRSEEAVRESIRKTFDFGGTVAALQETAFKLRTAENQPGALSVSNVTAASAPSIKDQHETAVQQTIIASNEALAAAQSVVTAPASASGSPAAQTSSPAIGSLIQDLNSQDDAKRRNAWSELALQGQDVVKPLVAELSNPGSRNAKEDANMRLGVAIALSRMQQPITLDDNEARLIVALLAAPEKATRIAAADFLMNLENRDTVLRVYDNLAILIHDRHKLENGTPVKNAATILGTWVRVLPPDMLAADNITPMRSYCRKTVEKMRLDLEKENYKSWEGTIGTIIELLQRADRSQNKALAAQ